jgi:uncharacterized protein (TIGR01615 family)
MGTSPAAAQAGGRGAGAFFASVAARLTRSRSRPDLAEGSSRRGRRYGGGAAAADGSSHRGGALSRDSSTHSVSLFDLELSHRGARRAAPSPPPPAAGAAAAADAPPPPTPLERIAYLGRPTARFEVDLLQDVRALRGACAAAATGELDLERLCEELGRVGYACRVRRNDPGGEAQQPAGGGAAAPRLCLEVVRHAFIACAGRADGSAAHACLVDPAFREQFEVGQPTAAYAAALAAAPAVFVGSALRLQALASALCREIVAAYAEQGLSLPPWRKPTAMFSRWFDVAGGGPAGGARAAPAPPPAPVALAALAPPPPAFFDMVQHHRRSLERQRGEASAGASPASAGDEERSNKPRRQVPMAAAALATGPALAATPPATPPTDPDARVPGGGWGADLAPIAEASSRGSGSGSAATSAGASAAELRLAPAPASGGRGSPGAVAASLAGAAAGPFAAAPPKREKAVSLLARHLKAMGAGSREAWAAVMQPAINTVRRAGSESRESSSRRGREGSSRRGFFFREAAPPVAEA